MNMSQRISNANEEQYLGECTDPAVREQVFGYLADLLEDEAEAEAVEDHLLGCRHCREFFLTMLNIRGEARTLRGEAAGGGANDAQVLRLADFVKEWP